MSHWLTRALAGMLVFSAFDALAQTTADIEVNIGTSPATYTPGATEANAYQFTVTNNDTTDAVDDVGVTMSFTAGTVSALSWSCAPMARCDENSGDLADLATTVDLGAGEAVTFTFDSITFDADATTTPLAFTATVDGNVGSNTDGNAANDSRTVNATIDPRADVRVTAMTDGNATYTPGGPQVDYDFTVTNAGGPSNIDDATVSLALDAGASLVSWTCTDSAGSNCDTASGGATFTGVTVDLDAGASVDFIVTIAYAASATDPSLDVSATASVPAGVTDTMPGNETSTDTDTRAASADLSITVDDSSASYTPGGNATYVVEVANAGPSDAVNVQVTDQFGPEFAAASWTCSASGTGSCANASGAGAGVDDIFEEMVYVAANGTATFTVTVTYASSAISDPLDNAASLTIEDSETTDPDGPMDGEHTNVDSDTLARQVATSVMKTTGAVTVVPNQDLEYTITVSNGGPSDLAADPTEVGVLLSDAFDPGLLGHLSECSGDITQPCWSYCDDDGGDPGSTISRMNCPDGEVISGVGDITNLSIRLAAGSSSVISAFVRTGGAGTDCDPMTVSTNEICNTASITAPQEADTTDTSGIGDDTASVANAVVIGTDIEVTKTDGATAAVAGTGHQYTVTVRNSGFLAVEGVAVTDDFPIYAGSGAGFAAGTTSWTCAAGAGACCQTLSPVCDVSAPVSAAEFSGVEVDLAPQSQVVFTISGTLDPLSAGTLSNTATAALPAGITETDPGNESSTDDDTVVSPAVDLTINKQLVSLTEAGADVDLEYQVVVTNQGPSFADDAAVADPFTDPRFDPASLRWTCAISGSVGSSACATAGPVMGPFNSSVDLDPGASAMFVLEITAAVGVGSTLSNTATVTHPFEIDIANNASTVNTPLTGTGDLGIVKSDFVTTATPGTETTYTLVVTNEGPDAVFGATVSDAFPAELTDVSWTCDATTPTPGDLTFFAESDQTDAGSDVLLSPDGRHVYVAAPDVIMAGDPPMPVSMSRVFAFTRNNIPGSGFGQISLLDTEQQGVDDGTDVGPVVDGLENPLAMAMDSLGQHLYVISDAVTAGGSGEAITLFTRNNNPLAADYGKLSFATLLADGIPAAPRGVLLSSDQAHVYVTGDSEIAIYARNAGTGALTYESTHTANVPADAGAILSGPGTSELHVASASGDVLASFSRITDSGDPGFGELAFLAQVDDAQLNAISDLVIAPDGRHVYAAATGADQVTILSVSDADGSLSILGRFDDADLAASMPTFATTTLTGVDSIAVSPDGEHVIAGVGAADGMLVFRRSSGGLLQFEQDLVDGLPAPPGVTSMALAGVSGLLVTGDGRHVLTTATASNSLGVYERRAPDPLFSFIEVERQGVDDPADTGGTVTGLSGASAVVVSRDGGHVYGAGLGSDAIAAFERFSDKGSTADTRGEHLNFAASYDNAGLGITGLADVTALAISPGPNHAHLFATSIDGSSLVSFLRNEDDTSPNYGQLTFVAEYFEGVAGAQGLQGAAGMAIDPATRHLYVTGKFGASISTYQINADGTLVFLGKVANGDPGVTGLGGANAAVVSPDGEHVIVASSIDDRVVVLKRNVDFMSADFGLLTFVQAVTGVGDNVMDLDVSADGEHVYAVASNDSRLTVLRRIASSADLNFGKLTVVASYVDGDPNHPFLRGARSVRASPDGKRVYVGAELDHALSVYDRDQNESGVGFGGLTFVEARRDEVDGVDGLNQIYALDVSADNRNVYAAGFTDAAVAAFVLGVGSTCTAGGAGNIDDVVDIGAGGTLTYTATGTIRPDAMGTLVNSASVIPPAGFTDLDNPPGSPDNNESTDSTTLVPAADLSITKTNERTASVPGEAVTYTVTVTNNGPSNAVHGSPSAVTVTDIFGPGFLPGTTWTCLATGSGALSFVEASLDGVAGFAGLDGVTSLVTVPDLAGLGPHLVAASVLDNAVLVFRRSPADGRLTQVFQDMDVVTAGPAVPIQGARAVAASADGDFIYVASQVGDSVTVFGAADDAGSVRLTALEFHDFSTGVTGLNQAVALAFAPGDVHLYAAGANSDTIVVFARNAVTGLLTHVETLTDGVGGVFGLAGVTSLAVSPDGRHLYATAADAESLTIFERDPGTGSLSQISQVLTSGTTGFDLAGAARATVSPLGDSVYVVSVAGHSLSVFARDTDPMSGTFGELTALQELREADSGVGGLLGARDVLVSADGFHVYVAAELSDSVAWFGRNLLDGKLKFAGIISDAMAGNDGLDGAGSLAIDAAGRRLYAAGVADDGIALLNRSADSLCPASGSGDLNALPINVAAGGSVVFTIEAIVSGTAAGQLENVASVSAAIDPDASNDSATDTDNLNPSADLAISKTDGLTVYDGLSEAAAISGNQRDLYVASPLDNAIGFLQRVSSAGSPDFGRLSFRTAWINGVDGVSGLGQVNDVLLSEDGTSVYAAGRGDNALAVFSRDATTGELTFLEVHQNGVLGVTGISGIDALALSPDGEHVYATGPFENSVAVFDRVNDGGPDQGRLSFAESIQHGVAGVGGLQGPSDIVVSPDGLHVYVSASTGNSVSLFLRNPTAGSASFGRLTYVSTLTDGEPGVNGLAGANALALSRLDGGLHLYVLGPLDQGLALIERDPVSGALSFVEFKQNGTAGVAGLNLAAGLTLSRDEAHLYVAGAGEDAIAVFDRDAPSGALTFDALVSDGDPLGPPGEFVDGLSGVTALFVPPDQQHLYAVAAGDDSIAGFDRDDTGVEPAYGSLDFVEVLADGGGGVAPGATVTYTIEVSNLGPGDVIGATVTDVFPPEFEQVEYFCAPSGGAACDGTVKTGSINENVNIPAGDRVTFSATGTLRSNVTGVLTNTASVSPPAGVSDPNTANNSATDNDTVLSPAADLLVTKSNGVTQLIPGTPVSYTVEVTNPGPSDAPDTLVTDLVPESVTDVAWTCTAAPEPGLLDFAQLAPPAQDGFRNFAASPDGAHLYAVGLLGGSSALTVFERDQRDGALTEVETYQNGTPFDSGVASPPSVPLAGIEGASAIAISGDGRHVYVVSDVDDALVVFARDPATGALTFTGPLSFEVHRDGLAGVNGLGGARVIRLSPDNAHVYVGGYLDNAIAVFARNQSSGSLAFVGAVFQGQGGVDGLNGIYDFTFDAGGTRLYAVGENNDAVALLTRDPGTGMLAPTQVLLDFQTMAGALLQPRAVTRVEDTLYVASFASNGIAIVDLDEMTGLMSYRELVADGAAGVTGLLGPESIVVAPGGGELYVAASTSGTVSLFRAGAGGLTQLAVYDAIAFPSLLDAGRLLLPADAQHLYVAGEAGIDLSVFERLPGSTCGSGGSGQLSDVAQLSAGGAASYEITGLILPAATGTLVNTASATEGPSVSELDRASNFATDADPLVPTSDASVSKTDHLTEVVAGTALTYDIGVFSTGPSALYPTVSDPLPMFPAAPAGFESGTVSWDCSVGKPLQLLAEYADDAANGLAGASHTVVSEDGAFVYVSTAGGHSISVFSRAAGGALSFVARVVEGDVMTGGTVTGLTGANGLALSPDGAYLYAAGEGADSVVAFTRDATTGLLDYRSTVTSGTGATIGLQGPRRLALTADGSHLYVASATSDAITVFAVGAADGGLTFVQRVKDGLGTIVPESDVIDEVADLVISPDDRFVYAVAIRSSAVSAFERNPVDGKLTFIQVLRNGDTSGMSPAIGLDGVGAIAMSPNGNHVYAVGGDAGSLLHFARDAGSGRLSFVSALLDAAPGAGSLARPVDVELTRSGARAFVLDGAGDAVGAYDRNPSDGSLLLVDVARNLVDGPTLLLGPAALAVPGSAEQAIAVGPAPGSAVVIALAANADCLDLAGTSDMVAVDLFMDPGSAAAVAVTAQVHPSARGVLVNRVDLLLPAGSDDPDPADNLATDQTTIVIVTDVHLTKEGPAEALAGESVQYTLTLTNSGPSDALEVNLVDPLIGTFDSAQWTCAATGRSTCPAPAGSGDLDERFNVGIDGSVVFSVTAVVPSSAFGPITNTATAIVFEQGANTDVNLADNVATVETQIARRSDLGISKDNGATSVTAGVPVSWDIQVVNAGPSDDPAAAVTDFAPATLENVTWTCAASPGSACAPTGTGDITDTAYLAAGGVLDYVLEGFLPASAQGVLENAATVEPSATSEDPAGGNNVATDVDPIVSVSDLIVVKDDLIDPYDPDGPLPLPYRVTVTNAGPSDAREVTLTDTIGAGGDYFGSTGCIGSPTGALCDLGTIPSAERRTVDIEFVVGLTPPDTIDNVATVESESVDPDPSSNTDQEQTTLATGLDIRVTKLSSAIEIEPGKPLSYTVTVENIGSVDTASVDVMDLMPAGLLGVTWTCTAFGGASCTPQGTGDVVDNGTYPSGGRAVYVITATADPALSLGAIPVINNTASATVVDGVDFNPLNNTDTRSLPVRLVLFADGFE